MKGETTETGRKSCVGQEQCPLIRLNKRRDVDENRRRNSGRMLTKRISQPATESRLKIFLSVAGTLDDVVAGDEKCY